MLRRLAVLVLLLVLAGAGGAWWVRARLSAPYRGFADAERFVDIPVGSSVGRIGTLLADAGIVADSLTFRVAARLSGQERHLQAGEYRFAEAASPYAVVARLAGGDVFTRPVTFREGLTIREMARVFATAGLGAAAEFEAAAREVSLVADLDPTARTLEGYLFPDTYRLPRGLSPNEIVGTLIARFARAWAPLAPVAAAQGLSQREVVTLASIVEKETGLAAERPLVAGVFRNRLRLGMRLESDPTVIYGIPAFDGNLRRVHLDDAANPYNTYQITGLPPGPIASPGEASLRAVLEPADTKALYFVGRGDGSHAFSERYDDHVRAVNQYQRSQRRNGR